MSPGAITMATTHFPSRGDRKVIFLTSPVFTPISSDGGGLTVEA